MVHTRAAFLISGDSQHNFGEAESWRGFVVVGCRLAVGVFFGLRRMQFWVVRVGWWTKHLWRLVCAVPGVGKLTYGAVPRTCGLRWSRCRQRDFKPTCWKLRVMARGACRDLLSTSPVLWSGPCEKWEILSCVFITNFFTDKQTEQSEVEEWKHSRLKFQILLTFVRLFWHQLICARCCSKR